MPSSATLARLSSSSSSKTSVSLSSSSWRRRAFPRPARGPRPPYTPPNRRLSSGSMLESSSEPPALMAAAESETRWFPRWVKAPSILNGKWWATGTSICNSNAPDQRKGKWGFVKLVRREQGGRGGRQQKPVETNLETVKGDSISQLRRDPGSLSRSRKLVR